MIKNILKDSLHEKFIIWRVIAAIILVLGVFTLADTTDIFEKLLAWFRQYQNWHDGYILAAFFLAFISNLFAWRSWVSYRKEIKKRKAAEKDATYRLTLEHTVLGIASRFMNACDIDRAIDESLADIGLFTKSERVFLFLLKDNGKKMDNTHEWCAKEASSIMGRLQNLDCDAFPWSMATYDNGEILCINNAESLPKEAASEVDILTKLQVKSLIAAPIKVKEELIGFIGINQVSHARVWNKKDMVTLHFVSGILANALQRWKSEESLQQAYNDLEKRVAERTAKLQKSNELLQQEIKEHRDTELSLLQSEQRYRRLIELLPDALFVHNEGRFLFTNEAGMRLFGIKDKSDLIGKRVMDFVHSDFHELVCSRIEQMQEKDSSVPTHAEKFIRADGTSVDVEVTATSFPYEEKRSVLAIAHDITERRHMEQVLKDSKQRYSDLIEALPDAVLIHTFDTIVFANQATAKLLNLDHFADILGRSIMDFMPSEQSSIIQQHLEKVIIGRSKISPSDTKIMRANGSIIDLELTAIPYIYVNTPAALIVLRDITERKQTERLNRILNETIEYDKIKTEFFSNISHEFKTPLNVILGTVQLLDLLLQGRQIEKTGVNTYKYIMIMKQNCYRLLRLVNNLIDITRIDSGFYKLELSNHNIVSVVEDVCMSVAEYIKSKNIQFEFDTDIEEKIIACDPDKMERVILNLLSNAIKFTDSGGSIHVNIHDYTDKILLLVKDTGVGIPKDKLETIFSRFRQVDKSLSRNSEGSGIGLSLVKSLIEMHGGSVQIQSEEGTGSEFIIQLPVHLVEETSQPKTNYNAHRSPIERIQIEFSDIYS